MSGCCCSNGCPLRRVLRVTVYQSEAPGHLSLLLRLLKPLLGSNITVASVVRRRQTHRAILAAS